MPDLTELILRASEMLDPQHQGLQWPDPIGWDGRPLEEQARDLCALLDNRGADAAELSDALWNAAGGAKL